MLLFQVVVVTWIAVTAPEPCPKKYIDMGGDVIKYCEMTPVGVDHYMWALKKGDD